MGLRKLTCPPLAGPYEKLVFRNIINHTWTGQLACVTENHIDSQFCLKRKKNGFCFLEAEPVSLKCYVKCNAKTTALTLKRCDEE